MTVVTDTTAVTTLLKAGEERLLREIFVSVIVPQAVWDELLAFHSHLPDFVLRRPVLEPNQRLAGTELFNKNWSSCRSDARRSSHGVLDPRGRRRNRD